jgi:MFS family permease
VWRAAGMLDLAVLSVFGFSGYAALLATAPLWAVNGGATAAGSGLVNGVLLAATVLAQLAVPRALVGWGTGGVLVAGLLLLGVPAPGYLLSDGLGWVLGLSAVRGLGFGILTVVGSTVVTHLVPAGRRGAAIGVYGLAVAVPNLLLLPGSVPVVDRWGFGPVFWAAALPTASRSPEAGIEARWAFPAGQNGRLCQRRRQSPSPRTVQRAHRRVQPAATTTSDLSSLAVTRQSSPSSSCSSCGSR